MQSKQNKSKSKPKSPKLPSKDWNGIKLEGEMRAKVPKVDIIQYEKGRVIGKVTVEGLQMVYLVYRLESFCNVAAMKHVADLRSLNLLLSPE